MLSYDPHRRARAASRDISAAIAPRKFFEPEDLSCLQGLAGGIAPPLRRRLQGLLPDAQPCPSDPDARRLGRRSRWPWPTGGLRQCAGARQTGRLARARAAAHRPSAALRRSSRHGTRTTRPSPRCGERVDRPPARRRRVPRRNQLPPQPRRHTPQAGTQAQGRCRGRRGKRVVTDDRGRDAHC